jgi:hypothetical protein
VSDLGSLAELTQSLLPSVGGATPMAALSTPMIIGQADSSGPTANTGSPGDGGVLNESAGGGDPTAGDPGDPEDTGNANAGGGDPGGAPVGSLAAGGDKLPFTGFAAGAVGAVGAALTGAGVALRRATRRR